MKMIKSSIVCVVLVSSYLAQGQMYSGEWMNNLFNSVNRMSSGFQGNIMNMNQQILENARLNQQQINQITADNLQHALATGNLQQDQQLNTATNGHSINSGVSKSVISGVGPSGQPYYLEAEDNIVGNVLYHTDKVHHPSLQIINVFQYSLDLTDPNAKPTIIRN